MSAPKPRPAPVISQTFLVAMVPSCIGGLSVSQSISTMVRATNCDHIWFDPQNSEFFS
jgi:hypothetical protein